MRSIVHVLALYTVLLASCADLPRLDVETQAASVVDHFVDPAGLHPDAAITMPSGTMPAAGWPLVMPFHRYSGTHTEALSRLGFGSQAGWPASPIADRAIIIWPDGTKNPQGFQMWNATSGCCDPSLSVDDIGYAEAARAYAIATFTIDTSKIAAVGISNGGTMAEALVCSHPDHWTRALDASGVAPKPCTGSDGLHTVSLMKNHGDADTTLFFDALTPHANTMTFQGMADTYPAADDASQYGCTSFVDTGTTKDYESTAGYETHVLTGTGCPTGTTVTLYRAYGGIHSPSWITSKWQPDALAYLGI